MADTNRDSILFPKLTEAQLAWLAPHGRERSLEPGEVLFQEGDTPEGTFVALEGELRVTKQMSGQETVITVHTRGEFTGELSLLTGANAIATARAIGPARVLFIDTATFKNMVATCPEMRDIILPALVQRGQDVDVMAQQREKLAALGKLSAGLAHELNNPAAANLRAAQELREVFRKQQTRMVSLSQRCLPHTQQATLCDFVEAITNEAAPPPLDTLARSDREDALAQWFDAHDIADGWELAPAFVSRGVEPARLETFATGFDRAALPDALAVIEATLTMNGLIDAIESSATRVATLVKAVKEYSYMDQAPLQEMDVTTGLDNTLTILNYKIKHGDIAVMREFEPNLPRICAYGSELNQVWTNLLDNAIDALQAKPDDRKIWVRAACENDRVRVEIADNGPGIPEDIQARIFDPFFTTKGVGKGTGLGLDISFRVVVKRHGGDLQVRSQPGDTVFTIRLPLEPPK